MSGRTRVAPGRRRRAAAAAAARLAVGHPPGPPRHAATRSWIVQPVRDRATGARSMPDTNMAKFSFVVPCGPPSHTREPTQERRLCAETRHPGSHKFVRNDPTNHEDRTETERRAHQPSPHARDRVREPESMLYCDCGAQADRQSVGRRMADEGPSERSAASDRHMTPHARLPCCHSLIWLRRL